MKPEASSKYAMDNFSPVGLHVLVVDDDPLCLVILENMLQLCSYKEILRDSEDNIDLVLSDVYMPDVDGFKLLEIIGLELDIPVIMMSANGDTSVVMKGITYGACDYLIKPVRMEELRNIWQHVVRKKGTESPKLGTESTSPSELLENSKKRKEVSFMGQDLAEDASILKRARVNWTVDLHQRFVNAVNQLGVEKAVPRKLLDVMNIKGLTRENVSSHLQKYRLYIKQLSGAKLERHPIASFQAREGGGSGGSMHILPGGRSPSSVSSIKGLNLRAGITESNVCAQNLDAGIATVLKASQQKLQRSANRAQVLGALGFVDSCPVGAAPRKASFDLGSYLQVPQSHLLSSCSMPSSLGGFPHNCPQPLKLEDEMGARPHGVQGEGFVSRMLSSGSMPSSLGVCPHSSPQPLKLGARPRGAQVEGFVGYWNINPVDKHDLGKNASADAQMQGSYGDKRHEDTQAGRCVEIPDDRNLSAETSSCTPTTEMNRETHMDALDSAQIPEEQLSVSDYLLDEELTLVLESLVD